MEIIETHYMRVNYVDEDGVVYSAKEIKEYDYKLLKTIYDERIIQKPNGNKARVRYTTKCVAIRAKQGNLFE